MLRLGQRLLEAVIPRDVAEEDPATNRLSRPGDERDDLDVHVAQLVADLPLDVAEHDRVLLDIRLLDAGPQLHRPERDLEVLDRPPEVVRREAEVHACLLVGKRKLPVLVDHDLRKRRGLEARLAHQRLVRQPRQVGVVQLALFRRRAQHLRLLRHLPEHPALEVDRLEELRPVRDRLRLAEEEEPVLEQREMKLPQDVVLRLRVEIHERVA